MSDFDNLDEMTGSMSDWVSKKQQATTMTPITPAKNDKLFEVRTKVSADPSHPHVASILELLDNKVYDSARQVANASEAPEFLDEFITEYIKNDGQAEGKWLFVRQIQQGKKGKNAKVKVELSYDQDGDLNVVDVPKSMIYAVDGRKWKKTGINNLLPQQPVESTPDSDVEPPTPATSQESVVSVDNPTPDMADELSLIHI